MNATAPGPARSVAIRHARCNVVVVVAEQLEESSRERTGTLLFAREECRSCRRRAASTRLFLSPSLIRKFGPLVCGARRRARDRGRSRRFSSSRAVREGEFRGYSARDSFHRRRKGTHKEQLPAIHSVCACGVHRDCCPCGRPAAASTTE